MLFLVLVTSTKHYWIISAERRRVLKAKSDAGLQLLEINSSYGAHGLVLFQSMGIHPSSSDGRANRRGDFGMGELTGFPTNQESNEFRPSRVGYISVHFEKADSPTKALLIAKITSC